MSDEENWRSQMFKIRAEDLTGESEYVEQDMPLEHVLAIIEICLKQRRNVMIGTNFLKLLMSSNPKATNLLNKLGYVEFKRTNKEGKEK